MKRTRDWMKFGGLVAVTLMLGGAFASLIESPGTSYAQQRQETLAALTPKPHDAPVAPTEVAPAVALSNAFSAVARAIRPAVVYVQAETKVKQAHPDLPPGFQQFFPQFRNQAPRIERGEGSGFIISPDGYILTNNHVVDGADKLTVTLFDKRTYRAKVIGHDPQTDIAVIKIDAHNLPTATLGNSDSLQVGDWVLAIGNPLGKQFSFTVTAGIVSAKGRLLRGLQQSQYSIQDFIQTDAAINPGNSGGPLVDLHGDVVGINSAIASANGYYEGYGFAIPIDLVRTVAGQLIKTGKVTRAVLGISIRDANPADAAYVGMKTVTGVTIMDYSSSDSPAKQAGLEPGDVITMVNGDSVDYVSQLQQLVGFQTPGSKIHVTVMRHGSGEHTYDVRLVAAPSADSTALASNGSGNNESASPESKLGISVKPLTPDLVQNLSIPKEDVGLAVTDIKEDSPLRGVIPEWGNQNPGAIITWVDGRRVKSVKDFQNALKDVKNGDIVSMRYYVPDGKGGGAGGVYRFQLGGVN
ncbi:MAG TPA: Do family serine endopeptidase [Gemmatimonadales bacterium]|nr:Do family serine endopeptidase [Gemmatimonadales bacterium]